MRESTRTLTEGNDVQRVRPRWSPIALFWLVIGCLGVAFSAVTLVVAGMDGALGCMAFGIVAIIIARHARHWS
ncbi:putative lipoprotein [Burkholderia contaminans]|uniref:hypothetical protein n=1 Tax=Burkholderia contaminans TaxID=488447 RepID=UPI0014533F17|nr:hypothetical protein [Burkholderia contaminans]VWC93378.1 putative lipoprotein [Burkholderia contaminans]